MDYNSMNQGSYQYEQQKANQVQEEPVSFKEWMLTFFIMIIPCVNIIMIFVWAFSQSEKKSKSNYFKAMLLYTLIMMVFTILLSLFLAFIGIAASGI